MAWRKLGVALGNAGMPRVSRDSALEAAYRHRMRMTDVERYLTTGSYFSSATHYDRKKSIEGYEAVLRIDSLNAPAINNLAIQLIERREFARAEALLRRAIKSGNMRATMFVNLGDALIRQGKFAAVDSIAEMGKRQFPQNANMRTLDIFTLTGQRNYDSLEKRARWVKDNDPEEGNRSQALGVLSDVAFIRGRIREALRIREEAYAFDAARGDPPGPFVPALDSAWAFAHHLEDGERGARVLDQALSRRSLSSVPIHNRNYLWFAMTYALAKKPASARRVLAEFNSQDTAYRRSNEAEYHITLGAIAYAEGRLQDAIREIRIGERGPDGPRDSCEGCVFGPLSRAFDAAGMRDSAIAAYESFVTIPSPFTSPDDFGLARAHRRLGQLYEAKGDKQRAVRHYRRFVDLWAKADPELQPLVAEARVRLSALTRTQ